MLKNYILIAWRNITKNISTSIINIIGLATGLTCCMLMLLYMRHELSYDEMHLKGDRLARVIMEYSFNGSNPVLGNYTSTKVLPAFQRNIPEIENGVRISDRARLVKYNENIFYVDHFVHSDSAFFQLFDFRLVQGDRVSALKQPNQVVLSASLAKKLFGSVDPMGKSIQMGSDQTNYLVTGIAEDAPSNTHIKFDCIASFISLGKDAIQEETYYEANFYTYLLRKPNTTAAALQANVNAFMKKEMSDKQYTNASVIFHLEPFTKIHLYSPYEGFEANSDIKYIYIVGGMALLILLIACFTYINLSVARSMERAREVGIRKSVGAVKNQVFWQFIAESCLITMISFLFSFLATWLMLTPFNDLSGKHLVMTGALNANFISIVLGMIAVISLLAGSYPAMILSKYQPVKVLKGLVSQVSNGNMLRQSLIVFQFFISVFLIAATIIISAQLKYIQTANLGYNRDQVIVMRVDQKMRDQWDVIKNELKSNNNILSISKADFIPVNIPGGYAMYRGDQTPDQAVNTRGNNIDEDYVKTNGLQILDGNDLSRQDMLDASHEDYKKNFYHFVINETAAKALGWSPQDAVGKKLFLGENRPGEIKAVIKDFNFSSLHSKIEPLVLFSDPFATQMMIKITRQDLTKTIDFLQNKMKVLAPHRPFEYHFMDEDFNKMYDSELRAGKVFKVFSFIAILLASLGLFGLSTYTAKQRIKEIGIRKVLGASVTGLLFLLSRNFIKLVAISFLFAIPLVWILTNQWLQTFAYRIHIQGWMFAMACGLTLLIAMVTVSFQTIKAAIANPVNSLKNE